MVQKMTKIETLSKKIEKLKRQVPKAPLPQVKDPAIYLNHIVNDMGKNGKELRKAARGISIACQAYERLEPNSPKKPEYAANIENASKNYIKIIEDHEKRNRKSYLIFDPEQDIYKLYLQK